MQPSQPVRASANESTSGRKCKQVQTSQCEQVGANASGSMYDLSVLWHTCTGASCEFCIMRSKNLIELRCFLKIAIHQVQYPPAVQLQAHFVEWN